ncbi:MAG TPA: molybdenum cofactor biosynthesis protein MoaE [Mycobacteriales bacterium]|nr:molybdenum cofactor biosynthesis protein MoaE [Mycobacteriales bacterium]
MTTGRHVDLRHAALSVDECLDAVRRSAAGGLVLFTGVVREEDHGRAVAELEYTAHPTALADLAALADRICLEHPAVTAVAAVHRLGRLAIGDIAVVVAVSAPHRGEAFAAARALIDELKATVPIWKRQVFVDGTVEWVGCA